MSFESIPDAFDAVVAHAPTRVALVDQNPHSYTQLQERSDRIARWLITRGIGRGKSVGLYAQRSRYAIEAIIGILKAGAAYVPFDLAYPEKLLRYLYEDSSPSCMLIEESLLNAESAQIFWTCETLALGAEPPPSQSGCAPVRPPLTGEDVAYIMYTSGSTGRPKGVVVPHRAVLRLVLDNDFAALGPAETILQLAPLSFDASTFEIWGALLNAGTLAVVSDPYPSLDRIATEIARHKVTTLWLTAGLFHLMVDHRLEGLRPLRQLLAGGDVLSPSHVAKAVRGLPGCRVINGYGPTENTTFSCCYTVPLDFDGAGPIPIGRPIRQTEAHVLNDALEAVTAGEDGELYVGGAGLAHGYLNRPELTAERFVPHPFNRENGARLYRTGDRVRRRTDGNLEFLGRIDRQIKINGKRIELDEIEAQVRASGLVEDAAVVTQVADTGHRTVAAFVTPQAGRPVSVETLRRFLREELPDYMVPATIVELPALPLSPTGKIDRARLLEAASTRASSAGREPVSAVEHALIEIWCRVLGRERIGTDDNFFDLGGTSLQLLEAHASINNSLSSDLTIIEMFEYPRVSALAERIAQSSAAHHAESLGAQERALRQREALARRRAGPTRRVP